MLCAGWSHVAGWRHICVEGEDHVDVEYQADKLHEEGNLFGEVLLEEDAADGCDDLDENDGDSPNEEETATPAGL